MSAICMDKQAGETCGPSPELDKFDSLTVEQAFLRAPQHLIGRPNHPETLAAWQSCRGKEIVHMYLLWMIEEGPPTLHFAACIERSTRYEYTCKWMKVAEEQESHSHGQRFRLKKMTVSSSMGNNSRQIPSRTSGKPRLEAERSFGCCYADRFCIACTLTAAESLKGPLGSICR